MHISLLICGRFCHSFGQSLDTSGPFKTFAKVLMLPRTLGYHFVLHLDIETQYCHWVSVVFFNPSIAQLEDLEL